MRITFNSGLAAFKMALFVFGMLLVAWAASEAFGSLEGQRDLQEAFAREIALAGLPGEEETGSSPDDGLRPTMLGRLEIDRLDINVIVLDGVTSDVLRRGAGHVPGTGLPGGAGNAGIAAHRDTFFLGLGGIEAGDILRFTSPDGTVRRYEVESSRVVGPEAVEVLDDRGYPAITLVTCYPFDIVGPAPDRFIVHARELEPVRNRPYRPMSGSETR